MPIIILTKNSKSNIEFLFKYSQYIDYLTLASGLSKKSQLKFIYNNKIILLVLSNRCDKKNSRVMPFAMLEKQNLVSLAKQIILNAGIQPSNENTRRQSPD